MPTDQSFPHADASVVPVEGPTSASSTTAPSNAPRGSGALAASAWPFGANNEELPERLQEALRRIVQQFSAESESTRRQEIRRIK
jgi:hypothetical protein